VNIKLNYNDNIGKKYKAPFIKDNSKAFTASSGLSELEELKKAVRLTKMDIGNNIGNRDNLLVNISVYEKRIREIEKIKSNQNQVSELSDDIVIKVFKETEVSSSTWKKIDFSGKTPYKHPNSEVLKPKKPWWKFW
jgi:hypothetical protein